LHVVCGEKIGVGNCRNYEDRDQEAKDSKNIFFHSVKLPMSLPWQVA